MDREHVVPAVRVRDLTVVRGGREVLHGVDCDIRDRAVTGLLGPNGSGKSTLIRAIVGAQVVAGGTVTVLGLPAGCAELRGRVGYATQSVALHPDLIVREGLRHFATVLGLRRGEVARVVDLVGLGDSTDVLVGALSGGQRNRATLAVALLGDPRLLVLDEPAVGSDPVLREGLWHLFRTIAAAGACVLVSSHVMDEAARCDHLLLLRDGRPLATGTPAGLLAQTGADTLDDAFLCLVSNRAAVL